MYLAGILGVCALLSISSAAGALSQAPAEAPPAQRQPVSSLRPTLTPRMNPRLLRRKPSRRNQAQHRKKKHLRNNRRLPKQDRLRKVRRASSRQEHHPQARLRVLRATNRSNRQPLHQRLTIANTGAHAGIRSLCGRGEPPRPVLCLLPGCRGPRPLTNAKMPRNCWPLLTGI